MMRFKPVLLSLVLLQLGAVCVAQTSLPVPEDTDPVKRAVMVGSPPPPEKRVTLLNALQYPNQRWVFHHMRELGATKQVWRGGKQAEPLEHVRGSATRKLQEAVFEDGTGRRLSVQEWQRITYTDALLVLHEGEVAFEAYYAGMQPQQQHALWSLSKSFVGVLATALIHEGTLDPAALISSYVPELQATAWGSATLQQTLDMTTSIDYSESFSNPQSGLFDFLRAAGLIPRSPQSVGATHLYDFLLTLHERGRHGDVLSYKSVDTEVLGWVLERATGKTLSTLLSERIWSKLGAEQDAYYWLDPIGTETATLGLNATLRDLARFGEMVRLNGRYGGRQVLHPAVIRELRKGADRAKFAAAPEQAVRRGYSYHNQWWISHDADGTFEGKGLSGQHLHINPRAGVVIVKLSSHPVGETAFTHTLDRAAFAAITQAVRPRHRPRH